MTAEHFPLTGAVGYIPNLVLLVSKVSEHGANLGMSGEHLRKLTRSLGITTGSSTWTNEVDVFGSSVRKPVTLYTDASTSDHRSGICETLKSVFDTPDFYELELVSWELIRPGMIHVGSVVEPGVFGFDPGVAISLFCFLSKILIVVAWFLLHGRNTGGLFGSPSVADDNSEFPEMKVLLRLLSICILWMLYHVIVAIAISGDTPEVKVLVLTLATMALLWELRTLDLLSMMLEQSAGLLSKKLPPAAEFKES
ncbi:hypothetical protein Tco_0214980 [Tanacetum coccineum]